MAHQMVQEGALWPSRVIRLGPHWRNSKMRWANIVNAVLDVGNKNTIKLLLIFEGCPSLPSKYSVHPTIPICIT